MKKKIPLVSIIMATYNRAHLITNSLDSIQCQSIEDWECIIIDDGSSDKTRETINSYLETDERFAYYRRSGDYNKGLSGCRNMGLDLAKGNHYIFYDDDDIVHPQNLEISLSYLDHSEVAFCNYQKQPFYKKAPDPAKLELKRLNDFIPFGPEELEDFIRGQRPMASCTVLWKKKCFEAIRFNEELHYAEEWECYARILLSGFRGIRIEEVLYFNRKHLESNTGEFNSGNNTRKQSMLVAANLVLGKLEDKNFITPGLEQFFIRLGLGLKSYDLIRRVLKLARASNIKRLKFGIGYQIYPLLRPIFKIKSTFLS